MASVKICAFVALVSLLIPFSWTIFKKYNYSIINTINQNNSVVNENAGVEQQKKSLKYWGVCLSEWHSAGLVKVILNFFIKLFFRKFTTFRLFAYNEHRI